jgi:5-methylcytosine-specific restriction endonuclease McrA
MSIMTKQRCLVLNKNWAPVSTISLRRAITMVFSTHHDGAPKARIIEPESYCAMTWDEWSQLRPKVDDEKIQTGDLAFRVPEIILLSRFDKLPQPKVHFSRRNLYKRDNYSCQYCGIKPGSTELSVDHIIPKSQGGTSTWTNCVLSCIECNARKADKSLKASGMKLLSVPTKPKLEMFKIDGITRPIKSWEAFVSAGFWNVELKD